MAYLDIQKKRYEELCAKRDAKYAELDPIQIRLDAAHERVLQAQAEVEALVAEWNKALGDPQAWLDLKKEIGVLASVLFPRRS